MTHHSLSNALFLLSNSPFVCLCVCVEKWTLKCTTIIHFNIFQHYQFRLAVIYVFRIKFAFVFGTTSIAIVLVPVNQFRKAFYCVLLSGCGRYWQLDFIFRLLILLFRVFSNILPFSCSVYGFRFVCFGFGKYRLVFAQCKHLSTEFDRIYCH